ncbi:HTTM domain-containing protein [Leptospira sp. 2 VSF19]|uniref:HTTM domain-containing protein n=1 Tax=Leptospira soteropolitanensis TaxID=2950025 RepID=A0AAW5VIS7_9LEPT|nr:HTTM domain-containing protein [Leptospira soteropolitanensis]MCW7493020.1 HTTM domain-containing protein [Leptospira soteropolitanensis]MCW7500255.1 HTTM domain-containing protein [Leptospira soteropolitanensis]MCW7522506.1 HTTM domain-containing protein [Leptospira soteropolitanensis]MCW7526362.1 HTTM domain-containing protein [Leptospira soteropolitanensis]MCW7529526.1 HTTM domain-containing protein [Leptospira soteropolitanensis]
MAIKNLLQPVSSLSLHFFRIGYGFATTILIFRYFYYGWIHTYFIKPTFFFKHFGWEWVHPLPPIFTYLLFGILFITAFGIFLGYYLKINLFVFTVGFTWFHFSDATIYLNHYYLVSLLGFLLWLSPVSNSNHPTFHFFSWMKKAESIPKLWLYAFRIQMGLVYFFGGIAKLQPDWLFEALPLKLWLYQSEGKIPFLDPILGLPVTAFVFSWIGVVFDLSIPFLLCTKRFRFLGWLVVLFFHTFTSFLFPIGIFPIVMSLSSLIFFEPNWPKSILYKIIRPKQEPIEETSISYINNEKLKFGLKEYTLLTYLLLQISIPFRHIFYPGQVIWTEEAIKYSWQVMVADKVGSATFWVQNKPIDPKEILTDYQYRMMTIQPEHILQFAKYLQKREAEQSGLKEVSVYVQSNVSINGKPARPLFSPNEDLTKIDINFYPLKGLLR